jgi:hypothetical protein
MQNHFADLELEVREYLADPELRTKVLEDLAKTILSDLVKIKRPASANSTFIGASVPLLFSEGVIKGVASVIADEFGKNAEPKKPSKKQMKKQEWSEQADPKILMRLSTRAKNVCQEMGLLTLEDMRAASDVDYLLVRRCGKGTLHEVREFLARDGEPTAEELRYESRFGREVESALAKARLEQQSQT